ANAVVSASSNEIAITVGTCGIVPNPPQNLRAAVSGSTLTLTWDPPIGGCPASSYVLEAGSSSGAPDIPVTAVNRTTLTATHARNRTHLIRVRDIHKLCEGPASDEV